MNMYSVRGPASAFVVGIIAVFLSLGDVFEQKQALIVGIAGSVLLGVGVLGWIIVGIYEHHLRASASVRRAEPPGQ